MIISIEDLILRVCTMQCVLCPSMQQHEASTGHNRLAKEPLHYPTGIKRPQPPQKIETALALPVNCSGVLAQSSLLSVL